MLQELAADDERDLGGQGEQGGDRDHPEHAGRRRRTAPVDPSPERLDPGGMERNRRHREHRDLVRAEGHRRAPAGLARGEVLVERLPLVGGQTEVDLRGRELEEVLVHRHGHPGCSWSSSRIRIRARVSSALVAAWLRPIALAISSPENPFAESSSADRASA
jgi:hypothetical protein